MKIIKKKDDIKRGYKTALYLAVMKKKLKIIKPLLTNLYIDLDIYNTNGKTNNTVLDLSLIHIFVFKFRNFTVIKNVFDHLNCLGLS